MKSHFDHLLPVIPDLSTKNILDVGSGNGAFVFDAAAHGAFVTGIELKTEKVTRSREYIKEFPHATIIQGTGEALPFLNASFDFVNLCELIEHVDNPESLLCEVRRVLKPNGLVYMSVPNRFGIRDQHFHLYLLNWMPRTLAERYITLRGRGKDYHKHSGLQRISEMHYYTYSAIVRQVNTLGYKVTDIRLMKVNKKPFWQKLFLIPLYRFLRPWYFDSFHLLLRFTNTSGT